MTSKGKSINESNMQALIHYWIMKGLVQIAMTVGISYATIYFDKLSTLWFLLIPALM